MQRCGFLCPLEPCTERGALSPTTSCPESITRGGSTYLSPPPLHCSGHWRLLQSPCHTVDVVFTCERVWYLLFGKPQEETIWLFVCKRRCAHVCGWCHIPVCTCTWRCATNRETNYTCTASTHVDEQLSAYISGHMVIFN